MGSPAEDKEYLRKSCIIQFFKKNKYSVINKYNEKIPVEKNPSISIKLDHYAITTNYRVFIEQFPWEDFGELRTDKQFGYELGMSKEYMLQFLCEPNDHHEKRITVRLHTDRGVSAEGNRHRVNSPAEQSTRYCNFSKDKFLNEISISANSDFSEKYVNEYLKEETANARWKGFPDLFLYMCNEIVQENGKTDKFYPIDVWVFVNLTCEWGYMALLNMGWTPQQSRRVLPLDLHTEIVYTAYESDWKHFLDLRYHGTTGLPHPDMKLVAEKINELINGNECDKEINRQEV